LFRYAYKPYKRLKIMDKSIRWMITIVVLFLVTMLTINLTRRSNYKEYIYNNRNKIEHVSYNVRYDSLFNDTTHYYKLVDTLNDFNFFEMNLRVKNTKCYVIAHMRKSTINYILDSDLKYSFTITSYNKQPDSAIIRKLHNLKHNTLISQSKRQ